MDRFFSRISIIAILASFAAAGLSAQEALKSTEEEYYDFLSLTGKAERPTLGYRTLSDSNWTVTDENHVWRDNNLGTRHAVRDFEDEYEIVAWKIYGPEWYNSYNTAAPYGQNDGALWQGKGYNTSITAGARLESFGFELTFKPQVSYSQNKEFDLMPSVVASQYGYYQSGIDLPQRFGDSSFWTYDWGDTEIRYTWHTLTVGAGTQSPWLGPAWLNPMLGSNNAATYPKIDAGLRKTEIYMPFLGWDLGAIEGRVWLGRLEESDYFDANEDNDYRLLTGISASYAPSFIQGLTVGVNRIFMTDWRTSNLKYIKRLFTPEEKNASGTGNDEDQKVALFADWLFPQVGFEVYGELGIDDFTSDKVSNPFHTAIYTIGAKKSIPISKKLQEKLGTLDSEIIFEWNNFEMSQDFQLQWRYRGYYSHGAVTQGYTQKGQIIGAGSGYFGNSQFLGYKVYHTHGSVMLFLHRFCPDNNYIYNMAVHSVADDELYTHYALYRTYLAYGIDMAQYIGKNLLLDVNLSKVDTRHFYYSARGLNGYHISLNAKYFF